MPANVPTGTDHASLASIAPDDLGSSVDVATPTSIEAAVRAPGLFDDIAESVSDTAADAAAQIVASQEDASTAAHSGNGQGV